MAVERNHGRREGRLARLATDQNGVVSLAQLCELGWTSSAIHQRAEMGRLHCVFRGVYAVGHESIGVHGRLLAAALACGEGSAISHGSAAALWGLRDQAPALIDVIVPCQTGRKIDGIRARRCRFPSREEIVVREGIPSTTPSRTIIDLAGILGRGSMRRMVERAAVLGLLDVDAVDAAIRQGKGRPGMPGLRAILRDWRPTAPDPPRLRSDFEARLLPLIAAHGLPSPRCNQLLRTDAGHIEVDFLWEAQRLVVEADGRQFHDTEVAFDRDRRRDQSLALAGYSVVRITWRQVAQEPDVTIAMLRHLIDGGP